MNHSSSHVSDYSHFSMREISPLHTTKIYDNKPDRSGKPIHLFTLSLEMSNPTDGVLCTFIFRVFLFAACSVRMNLLVPLGEDVFGVTVCCCRPAACLTFEVIGTCCSFDICSNVCFSTKVALTASA